MAKQSMDDEASLKRRARRRLIGAVTLTTVIVVLLPMFLDSEPKPVGQDIELRIPDKDKVGEFAPRMDLSSASALVNALPVSAPASAAVAAPVIASPVIAASQTAAAPPAAVAAKAPESKPASAPAKPGEAVPESKPADHEHQSSFIVQIGAFSKAETAHYLQKKLSKEGFKVYTEKVADKIRVRAGPYATREAAEKVRRKLEAQGLHPDISQAPQP